MDIKAIRKLGYIYYMNKWSKKLKRANILDIQEMGNYILVLTEDSGLVSFHKSTYTEVPDKIYFLNTGVLIREHKKRCNDKISDLTSKKNYHKEEYVKLKKEISSLELEKSKIYDEVQDFFSEDKKILEYESKD